MTDNNNEEIVVEIVGEGEQTSLEIADAAAPVVETAPISLMLDSQLPVIDAQGEGEKIQMTPDMFTLKEVEKKDSIVAQPLDDSTLTAKEKEMVRSFAKEIDIKNSNQILMYGARSQEKIANFSEAALNKVRTKDMGEVGDMLTGLIAELDTIELGEKKGFFGKTKTNLKKMSNQYVNAEKNVDAVARNLESHQIRLMKDIAVLDQMYDQNLLFFKELTMYILAGKEKLKIAETTELKELTDKAQKSGLPEDAQAANDFSNQINRFEKKIHDLELTRIVSIQMGPQIRLVQNNDIMLVEKIQTSLVNTIPLWKNQMVLALGIAHSQKALESQRAVTNMTNELLRRNADTLKMGTIETAKESERGIVDIETLQHTNAQLISTLDEVIKIQEEGRTRRRQAEAEMSHIEGELKQKLLEVKRNTDVTGNITQ